MNILIFNWRDPKHPNAGGAEIATLEHAKYWTKKGHKVTWFSSSFIGNFSLEEFIDGVKIIRRSNQTLGVHIAAFFWYLFINKEKFDLVIDQFHGIPFFTPIYVRTKKLAYIHEVTKEVWRTNQLPKPLNLVPAFFGEITEKLIFMLFYKNIKFMTVSESTKKDLIEFGVKKDNIRVIYNGLHSIKLPNINKEKTPTVIYLGALAKDKGTDSVLELFDRLKQRHKNWQFWIAGRGAFEYTERLKKASYIKYFGFVTEKKKFELFRRAHIFVNPSIREGWGLTNLEANSQGTPVVGYNVPGVRDSVKNNKTGILVKKGRIDLLEKSVEKLISGKKIYKKISGNAEKWSGNFSWEEASRQSLEYILISP